MAWGGPRWAPLGRSVPKADGAAATVWKDVVAWGSDDWAEVPAKVEGTWNTEEEGEDGHLAAQGPAAVAGAVVCPLTFLSEFL